ncbi:IS110 family transposase [Ruania zhangjianzhongii]|uniref:IS110 family transposase n=1 Tax=Ruania zhangjianzhongii TaxID=2603206 RepID=UPI0011C75B6E|nr:IS110 family transposase [Ruania zhangjianzhongii]
MYEEADDGEVVVARVAALDVGKAEVVACVRIPGESGRRVQEIQSYSTMTGSLLAMCDHFRCEQVSLVVMEATGDYWKAPFYLLEQAGFTVWVVNARDVKHLPGRAKTDKLDAAWLCKVAERKMLRPSFVPPAPIRVLRDLTRYRVDLITARTAEKQRVEKVLDTAGVKVSVVASDIFGVSGRAMLHALIDGQRDPKALAELAKGSLRGSAKRAALEEAFTARFFTDHHAFLLATMMSRVERLDADIAAVEARIEAELVPFADQVASLDEIPGIGRHAAAAIIAEIGVDMSRFPTAGHLCSWARYAPVISQSAGKSHGKNATGKGDRYLARALGDAAVNAARTHTFLGERYRRLARRRGKLRANVAVGRSMLVIIWHLLSDPQARFNDLGPDYYEQRIRPDRRRDNHVRALQQLGYYVTLEAAA